MNNILMIIVGVVFFILGISSNYVNKYYVNNILPKRSLKEQEQYYRNEKKLSKMGAFNVPFKDGELISKGNRENFYGFIVALGIVAIIFGIVMTIFPTQY